MGRRPRVYIEVVWNKLHAMWAVKGFGQKESRLYVDKESASYAAFDVGKEIAKRGGLAEVVVKNKNGQIGRGHSSRRTYGADPKRSKW